MVTRSRRVGGISLIELLMAAAIMGIVVVGFQFVVRQLFQFQHINKASLESHREARTAMEVMSRFLRPAMAASIVLDQLEGQPPRSRVRFRTGTGREMVFYQDGTTLYHVGVTTKPVAGSIRSLTFGYPRSDEPNILAVSLTTGSSTFGGKSKTFTISSEKIRIMN